MEKLYLPPTTHACYVKRKVIIDIYEEALAVIETNKDILHSFRKANRQKLRYASLVYFVDIGEVLGMHFPTYYLAEEIGELLSRKEYRVYKRLPKSLKGERR